MRIGHAMGEMENGISQVFLSGPTKALLLPKPIKKVVKEVGVLSDYSIES